MSRSFLGDEVHQMSADLAVLRTELDSTKLALERKDTECEMLRRQLVEMRASYEEKSAEAVAIQTLLESMGQQLASGLTRYREQRAVRMQHNDEKTAVVAAPEKVATLPPAAPVSEYAPASARPHPRDLDEEKPLFLRQPREDSGDADHPLLPRLSIFKGSRS